MPDLAVPKLFRAHPTETWLVLVLGAICIGLSATTEQFFTLANFFNLLNTSSVNLIFAVGLLVVLVPASIISPLRPRWFNMWSLSYSSISEVAAGSAALQWRRLPGSRSVPSMPP